MKLLIITLFYATTAFAGPHYLLALFKTTMSQENVQLVLEKTRQVVGDTEIVDTNSLVKIQLVANTNSQWRVIPFDVERPNSPWAKLDLDKEKGEQWRDSHISPSDTNKLHFLECNYPRSTLRGLGFEVAPKPETP